MFSRWWMRDNEDAIRWKIEIKIFINKSKQKTEVRKKILKLKLDRFSSKSSVNITCIVENSTLINSLDIK
jgi:hypothetical protein